MSALNGSTAPRLPRESRKQRKEGSERRVGARRRAASAAFARGIQSTCMRKQHKKTGMTRDKICVSPIPSPAEMQRHQPRARMELLDAALAYCHRRHDTYPGVTCGTGFVREAYMKRLLALRNDAAAVPSARPTSLPINSAYRCTSVEIRRQRPTSTTCWFPEPLTGYHGHGDPIEAVEECESPDEPRQNSPHCHSAASRIPTHTRHSCPGRTVQRGKTSKRSRQLTCSRSKPVTW